MLKFYLVMLEIVDLKKDYKTGNYITNALKKVDLKFKDKGFYSILGPSGCGKSTLLNLIGLLDTPTNGKIIFNETNLSSLKQDEIDLFRNKYIGFVFQSYHLIHNLTCFENIALPIYLGGESDKAKVEERVDDILKKVGLIDVKDKKSSDLSGGQMQRISICRALINSPKIILADEPTGALDSKTSLEIAEILKKLSEEHLVIMVTHNKDLAYKYSDEIYYLNDGEITDHKIIKEEIEKEDKENLLSVVFKRRKLVSDKIVWSIAIKNLLSKKAKSIISAVANCFGLVALGFILALTNGFTVYSDRVSYETASSLPINVPAYTIKTDSESREDINQSTEFPDDEAIFPYVSTSNEYTYTYNNYTEEYFDLLDSLIEKGYAVDYILNYGNSFSYNLTTEYPTSLDKRNESYIASVNTNMSAGGSYTSSGYGIPTNIFHPLYGDIENSYDLLTGSLPKNKNEIVLVVDNYNAINFSTLQNMGFYNSSDTMDEVMNEALETKVEPISFDDVIGKKYKVFTNNEVYYLTKNSAEIKDFFNFSSRTIQTYARNNIVDLYKDSSKGIELTISGILRPKPESSITLISPSLCYLPELQEELASDKENSEIAKSIKNNLVARFSTDRDILHEFLTEAQNYINDYKEGNIEINATTFNELINKYFDYYYIEDSNHLHEDNGDISTWRRSNFSRFLNDAEALGANLVDEEIIANFRDLNRENVDQLIQDMIDKFTNNFDVDEAYDYIINLACYLNSYTTVQNIAIFPKGLEERNQILNILDEYNDSKTDESEQIHYVSLSSSLINSVSNMVSLVSLVLSIFVAVLLIVACAMNVLFTYNNVLERTKDIGILRAIGTTKFDISRMFMIEAGVVGLLSGLFSCLFTYVLAFPVNMLIADHYAHYFSFQDICVATWRHMLVLVGIAIILAVVSATIPAYSASKKDPVKCLKEE